MSKFDKNIKPGDMIFAYHAGYHLVTEVQRRFYNESDLKYLSNKDNKVGEEYFSLVFYTKVFDSKGKKVKGDKKYCCDASYCNVVSPEKLEKIIKLYEELEELEKEIKSNG